MYVTNYTNALNPMFCQQGYMFQRILLLRARRAFACTSAHIVLQKATSRAAAKTDQASRSELLRIVFNIYLLMSMEMVSTACFWLTACCLTAVLLKRSGALSDTGAPGAFFYESFGPGWNDRWHYTTLKKYQGVFETVQPESYQDTAIQVILASG